MTEWKDRFRRALGGREARREMAEARAAAALATLMGQRLKRLGLTQRELASRLDIDPAALSRKLHQGVDMRLSSVAAILWELGVPLYRELERLCERDWAAEDAHVTKDVLPFRRRQCRRSLVMPSTVRVEAPIEDAS